MPKTVQKKSSAVKNGGKREKTAGYKGKSAAKTAKKQNTKKTMNFSDVLQMFMPGGLKNKSNI